MRNDDLNKEEIPEISRSWLDTFSKICLIVAVTSLATVLWLILGSLIAKP